MRASLPPECQDVVVRALREDGTLRIIASAVVEGGARDADSSGRILPDLLHRLSAYTLRVPPYRDRPEDLLALAEGEAGAPLDPEVIQAFMQNKTTILSIRERYAQLAAAE